MVHHGSDKKLVSFVVAASKQKEAEALVKKHAKHQYPKRKVKVLKVARLDKEGNPVSPLDKWGKPSVTFHMTEQPKQLPAPPTSKATSKEATPDKKMGGTPTGWGNWGRGTARYGKMTNPLTEEVLLAVAEKDSLFVTQTGGDSK